jgi:hypothetical protein
MTSGLSSLFFRIVNNSLTAVEKIRTPLPTLIPLPQPKASPVTPVTPGLCSYPGTHPPIICPGDQWLTPNGSCIQDIIFPDGRERRIRRKFKLIRVGPTDASPPHLDCVAGPEIPSVVRSNQTWGFQGKQRHSDRDRIRINPLTRIDTPPHAETDQYKKPTKRY